MKTLVAAALKRGQNVLTLNSSSLNLLVRFLSESACQIPIYILVEMFLVWPYNKCSSHIDWLKVMASEKGRNKKTLIIQLYESARQISRYFVRNVLPIIHYILFQAVLISWKKWQPSGIIKGVKCLIQMTSTNLLDQFHQNEWMFLIQNYWNRGCCGIRKRAKCSELAHRILRWLSRNVHGN